MKRLSIVLVFTFVLLSSLYSQERNTTKEVGIYFSNLDAFGIRYKFGNEKHMFRITALSINSGNSNSSGNSTTGASSNSGAGLNLGLQFPISITEDFIFYYGGELQGVFSNTEYTTGNSGIYKYRNAGIGFVIGFSKSFKSNIIVSAEIIPGFRYSKSEQGSMSSESYGFGLDSRSAGITIGYKF